MADIIATLAIVLGLALMIAGLAYEPRKASKAKREAARVARNERIMAEYRKANR